MRPFQFRLETLLRLREAARDAMRVELALAIAAQQQLQAELAVVEQELIKQRQKDRELRQSSAFSLDLLRQSEALRQSLTAELARLSARASDCDAQASQCQQRLAEAEREYQAVAKLRAARLAEHQRDVQRTEARLADEAAGRQFSAQASRRAA